MWMPGVDVGNRGSDANSLSVVQNRQGPGDIVPQPGRAHHAGETACFYVAGELDDLRCAHMGRDEEVGLLHRNWTLFDLDVHLCRPSGNFRVVGY